MTDDDEAPPSFTVENVGEGSEAAAAAKKTFWFMLAAQPPSAAEQQKSSVAFSSAASRIPKAVSCPLCRGAAAKFYCVDCVNRGEFAHSNPRRPGDLAEKRVDMSAMRERLEALSSEVVGRVETRRRCQALGEQIREARRRVHNLRAATRERSESAAGSKAYAAKLARDNAARRRRLPQFVGKVDQMRVCVGQHLASLDAHRSRVGRELRHLAAARRRRLSELATIFPIDRVDDHDHDHNDEAMPRKLEGQDSPASGCFPDDETDDDDYNSLVAEMEDAMLTSHVHGRWVSSSSSSATFVGDDGRHDDDSIPGPKWRIVGPVLPADIGRADNQACLPAGLSLAEQFVGQAAACLDVILPKRMGSQQDAVTPADLARRVSRLNLNTVYLCLSQGMAAADLRPVEPLHNLFRLVDEGWGSAGALVDADALSRMSALIARDHIDHHEAAAATSEEDDEDILSCDNQWEAVPADMTVVAPYTPTTTTTNFFTSTAAAFVTSLLTSGKLASEK